MHAQNYPYVSVVIPTYNRKHLLSKTIASLLNQSYPQHRYEIIVVDDGSTDATDQLIQSMAADSAQRLRYFRQERRGPAAARNLGVENSKGDIIAFTDSDCIVDENWIWQAVKSLQNTGCTGVYGRTCSNIPPSIFVHGVVDQKGQAKTCNLAVRRTILEQVGGFDTAFKSPWLEDSDLVFRVSQAGESICYNPNMVVHHPSMYQSFFDYLSKTKFEQYHVLIAKRYPQKELAQYIISIMYKFVRQIALMTTMLLFPMPRVNLLVRLSLLVCVLWSISAYKLFLLRRRMKSYGMEIEMSDQLAFVLFYWLVHLLRGCYLIKGFLTFRDVPQFKCSKETLIS